MKKLFCMVLVFVMSLSVLAEAKIFVDIQEVETDTPAQIINDRTMVPVRAIAEMIGYDVYWIADKQLVEICEKGSEIPVIIMQIDNPVAYFTKYEEELGEGVGAEVILDSPPVIVNDRTLVPLRFISEAVGFVVEYDEETKDVYLFSPEYVENHKGEGKGEDAEGIEADGKGEAIELTYEEMEYVLAQTTESWLDMTDEEKAELVLLIGRWWEDYENIIVQDYDDMVYTIDHQMNQYHRNEVDANLFETVCEIFDVDKNVYMTE